MQRSVHDRVVEGVVRLAGTARIGNPADLSTQVGPITTLAQRARVLSCLDIARGEGARAVLSGTVPEGVGEGWFVEPTIFTGVGNQMRIAREEVFGPVLSIIPFDDEDEAFAIANDSPYGLAVGLWRGGVAGVITVVEKDPSYRFCSGALSAAAIRTQFGTPINIRISLYAVDFFRAIQQTFGPAAEIGYVENGYLILGGPETVAARRAGAAMQRAEGAEVTGFDVVGDRIGAVRLAGGDALPCDWCVTAAGAASGALMAGLDQPLPVSLRKRSVFGFRAPVPGAGFPMLFDTSGLWIRPEGVGFIGSIQPPADQDPDATGDFGPHHRLMPEVFWPALASRIPAMEELRLEHSRSGHYEVNALDHNRVVGWHDEIANLVLSTGFSGHGVMHAPAAGQCVAETILQGRFVTLDLSPLGYHRIRSGTPLPESIVYCRRGTCALPARSSSSRAARRASGGPRPSGSWPKAQGSSSPTRTKPACTPPRARPAGRTFCLPWSPTSPTRIRSMRWWQRRSGPLAGST